MWNGFYGWEFWSINSKMLPMDTENGGFGGQAILGYLCDKVQGETAVGWNFGKNHTFFLHKFNFLHMVFSLDFWNHQQNLGCGGTFPKFSLRIPGLISWKKHRQMLFWHISLLWANFALRKKCFFVEIGSSSLQKKLWRIQTSEFMDRLNPRYWDLMNKKANLDLLILICEVRLYCEMSFSPDSSPFQVEYVLLFSTSSKPSSLGCAWLSNELKWATTQQGGGGSHQLVQQPKGGDETDNLHFQQVCIWN